MASSVAVVASCGHEKQPVRVTLRDLCGLTDGADCQQDAAHADRCGYAHCSGEATWATLAVFENGCPASGLLHEGDLSGAIRVVTGQAGKALPSIGELDEGRFGFAGLLRGSDCAIVGAGCTEVDLSDERDVHIDVLPAGGNGFCKTGRVCEGGACVPSDDTSDGAAGCLPLLVASGTLPERRADSLAKGLGIVATDSGYLVGYREDVPSDGSLHVRLVPIGDDGAIGDGAERRIEHCVGSSEAGVAMAFSAEGGLLATSLASCEGHGAGAAFVAFTQAGEITDVQRYVGAGEDLRITNRSLASGRGPNDFELVYTTSGSAHRLSLEGARPRSSYEALFPEARGSFAQVASTQDFVARLVGAEDEVYVGIGRWEATPRTTRLEGGTLTSLAVRGNRFVVARSTASGLAWEGRTSSGASFGLGSFNTSQASTALDVVVANEEAILGAAHPTGIFVLPIGDMRSELAPSPKAVVQHTLPQGQSPTPQGLAMASRGDRFAVAWLNGDEGAGPVGGYAVFACESMTQ